MNVSNPADMATLMRTYTLRVLERLAEPGPGHVADEVRLGLSEARRNLETTSPSADGPAFPPEVLKAWSQIAAFQAAARMPGAALLGAFTGAAMDCPEMMGLVSEPVPSDKQPEVLAQVAQGLNLPDNVRLIQAQGDGLAANSAPGLLTVYEPVISLQEHSSRGTLHEWLAAHEGSMTPELEQQAAELARLAPGRTVLLDFIVGHEASHDANQDLTSTLGTAFGMALLKEIGQNTPTGSNERDMLDELAVASLSDLRTRELRSDREAVERMVRQGYERSVAALAGCHVISVTAAMTANNLLLSYLQEQGVSTHPSDEQRRQSILGQAPEVGAKLEPLLLSGYQEVEPGLARGEKDGWAVYRKRVHATFGPGHKVSSLPKIQTWSERTVDGVHERLEDGVLVRTADTWHHTYRNGELEETFEQVRNGDGSESTVECRFEHGVEVQRQSKTTGIPAQDGGPTWTEVRTGAKWERSRQAVDDGGCYRESVSAEGRVVSYLPSLSLRHPFKPQPISLPNGTRIELSGQARAGELELLQERLAHMMHPGQRVALVDAIEELHRPDGSVGPRAGLGYDRSNGVIYVDRRALRSGEDLEFPHAAG